jgi:ubiquinone/menaquinone biosynthesis C-methylase UbiE
MKSSKIQKVSFLDNRMTEDELKELASQLGKPEGENGIKIAHMMNKANTKMIKKTIKCLAIEENNIILELGHGNAHHIINLFNDNKNIKYYGLDISELMKQEAEKFSLENNLDKYTDFKIYDGVNIPFQDNFFDKIFTVNTIYFWEDPNKMITELYRVLKPKGRLCIAFNDKDTMLKQSFTNYGFTHYTKDSFTKLVSKSKFVIDKSLKCSTMIKSKDGETSERVYWIMRLYKEG